MFQSLVESDAVIVTSKRESCFHWVFSSELCSISHHVNSVQPLPSLVCLLLLHLLLFFPVCPKAVLLKLNLVLLLGAPLLPANVL